MIDDDRVEQRVRPGLVEKRNLDDGDGRIDACEPGCVRGADARMEQLLEPRQLVGVREDDVGDERAIEGAEALLESGSHIGILCVELVDDLDPRRELPRRDGGMPPAPRSCRRRCRR